MVRQLVKEVGGCPWCCGQDDGAAAGQNSERKGSVVTYLQLILGNQLKYNMKKLEEEQILLDKVLQAGREANNHLHQDRVVVERMAAGQAGVGVE